MTTEEERVTLAILLTFGGVIFGVLAYWTVYVRRLIRRNHEERARREREKERR